MGVAIWKTLLVTTTLKPSFKQFIVVVTPDAQGTQIAGKPDHFKAPGPFIDKVTHQDYCVTVGSKLG
eukprot:CAMPEP_0172746988 /NCGR_PEP_ID=MMETSP1074-20121228/141809_1 /TAXON_ID=2916 /ORGANISM="Ceratium fusus, Strain PA161109" /LENGTH=66 /DNA_ID=CAMNT_0013578437 /DNA_START=24 /DNA_END=220 /DNA_ORIENTATION=+